MKKWFQIGSILLLGIAIGLFLSRPHEKGQGAGKRSKEELIFASGELMLGDFESEKELERWEATSVSAFLSDEHVVRGKRSAKLTYGADQNPTFALEDFFGKNKKARDWRGYETLVFTLFNPGSSQQRLILQIKDRKSRRYKEDMFIPANNVLSYRIPLEDIASFVDLKEIDQLNFFRWNPQTAAIFFLDDVRLIPKDKKAQREESKVSSETEETTESGAPTASSGKEPFDSSIRANSPNAVSGLLFQQVAKRWQAVSQTTGETFLQVPIQVASLYSTPPGKFPVSGGVPFPYGLLKGTTSFRLKSAEGEEFPLQIRPLGFWEDGSVKWLLVDTQLPQGTADKRLSLEIHATPPPPNPESPLRLSEDPSSVIVTTGPLQFSVSKKSFTLFEKAFLDLNGDKQFLEEEKVADGGDLVIRFRGSDYRSSLDAEGYALKVEELGPLRVTLKASGWFRNAEGKKFCQYQVRIQAFAGRSDVRIYHTFIYTGYPANIYHHEYKEAKDLPENETIEEITIEHSYPAQKEATYQVGLPTQVLVGKMKESLLLSQLKQDSFRLLQGEEVVHEGRESSGWVNLLSPASGTSVFVRDFWQQYPKEVLVDPAGKMEVSLWPRSAGPLNLETQDAAYGPDAVARGSAFGLGKTHELIFSFHPGVAVPQTVHETLAVFQNPLVLHADPEWVYVTYALGSLGPHQLSVEGEELIARLFDWAARQPKKFGWYGMLDYGDTRFWHRKEAYDKSYPEWGWHPEGRWGWFNCEQVGTHAASLLQFARTGQYKYFAFGEASSRHIMDVDTIHYNTVERDPRLKGKIYSDHSHVGAMHRHNANHWGGRADEASHTHLLGFLLHYYLTGYERAFDVAKEVGSFYLRSPITYTRHPDIAPQRAIANILWGDTLLYEATHDKRYKEEADRWAALFVEGQREDGSWAKDYNPRADNWPDESDTRFMALHTLSSLITYHRLTGNSRVQEAILKGTDYLIQNEKYLPFFDALAYAYELSGEAKYLEEGRRRLTMQINAQDRSEDPLQNGMVFGKITYDRVPPLLYSVPYLLGVRNPAFLKPYYQKKESIAPVAPSEGPGLSYEVRIVSPFQRVLKDSPLKGVGQSNPIHLSLAMNEYESSQIVLSSLAGDLKEVRIQTGDLVNPTTGAKIDKKEIATYPVGYVQLKKSEYLPELIGLVPDPLPSKDSFEVKRGKLQPVWLTVYAPPGTPPGLYQGSLLIQPKNGPEKKVDLEVKVWGFELPKTSRLKTAFDLYTGRLMEGYQNFFPDWWAKWKDTSQTLEDRYYERMLQYRISPILNIDPTRPETIERVKRLLHLGMTSFGVGRYSGSNGNNWPSDLDPVVPLYRNYAGILRDHDLLDRSYLYTSDETPVGTERVAAVTRTVHEADPFLKNLVTLMETPPYTTHQNWFKEVDIVVLRNVAFDPYQAEEIRKAGKELWIYCSGPSYPYPTFVLDYPTMAYRILPWMCWKYKVTGLLYWCVNFWTKNPYTDATNTQWGQNANGVLFYPGPDGPVGSIRLELIRDGIEDYDMLTILSDEIAKASAKGSASAEIIQQAEQVLRDAEALTPSMREYPKQPDRLLELRERIAQAIEAL